MTSTKERFEVERDECVMLVERDRFGAGASFVEWRGARRQFGRFAVDLLHQLNRMADAALDEDSPEAGERYERLRLVRREIERRWTWLGVASAVIREAADR